MLGPAIPTHVPVSSRLLGPFGKTEQMDFKLCSHRMGEREVLGAAETTQLGEHPWALHPVSHSLLDRHGGVLALFLPPSEGCSYFTWENPFPCVSAQGAPSSRKRDALPAAAQPQSGRQVPETCAPQKQREGTVGEPGACRDSDLCFYPLALQAHSAPQSARSARDAQGQKLDWVPGVTFSLS